MAAATTVVLVAGAAAAGVAAGRAYQKFHIDRHDVVRLACTVYVASEIIKAVGLALISPSKRLRERYAKKLAPINIF